VLPPPDFIRHTASSATSTSSLDQETDGNQLKEGCSRHFPEETQLGDSGLPPTLSRLTEQVLEVADHQVYDRHWCYLAV